MSRSDSSPDLAAKFLEAHRVRYLIMIMSNPTFRDVWESWGQEQRMAFGREHMALNRELQESGEFVAGAALADPATAMRVSRSPSGEVISTDGPFAEAKEYLVGFLMVECADESRAMEIAAQVPDAQYGEIEVRPLMQLKSVATG